VSEVAKFNGNLPAWNTLVQLLALYCTPIPWATMHSVTDSQTDGQT